MPFVTKKPSHYFAALEEESTEPLHIGLLLAASTEAHDLISLGRSIRKSSRPVRCIWLRFKDGNVLPHTALMAFGNELVGATGIQSLVFEGGAGTDEVGCLEAYFANCDLRSLQFRKTNIDASTLAMLGPFFRQSTTLRSLETSSNPRVDDECIDIMLDSLAKGGTNLDTLNIGESNVDGQPDESNISSSGVASIALFMYKSECHICLMLGKHILLIAHVYYICIPQHHLSPV